MGFDSGSTDIAPNAPSTGPFNPASALLAPQNCTVNSIQHIIMGQLIRTGFPAIWLAKKWFDNIVLSTYLLLQQIIYATSDKVDISLSPFQALVNQTKDL